MVVVEDVVDDDGERIAALELLVGPLGPGLFLGVLGVVAVVLVVFKC